MASESAAPPGAPPHPAADAKRDQPDATTKPAEGEEERAAPDAAPESSPGEASEEAIAAGALAATEARAGGETPRVIAFFRDRYLTFDRRLLGLFRIYFGCLLLVDVLRRIPHATFFYSNEGVLSNHFSLFAPLAHPYFSLFTAFSTPFEVKAAMWLTALVYCFYIAGYRTRVFQVLAFVLYTSLDQRNIFIENGGCIVVGIVAAWSMFLPLGDRFSVDALLRSLRARRDFSAAGLNDRRGIEPPPNAHVSIVGLGVVLQVSAIYFFNTVHKEGATWKSGESIHWVLWQNRIATVWAAWLRMHEPSWLSPLLTRGALVIEGSAPLLAVFPFWQKYTRTALFLLTTSLHVGIALMMTLGPFSYVMIALNMLLLPGALFDGLSAWLERRRTPRVVVYDPTDAGLHHVARLLARLDVFRRLTFIDRSDGARLPEGAPTASFAALDEESGEWSLGTSAIVSAMRSLPAGPLWALLLGNPLGQGVLRMLLRRRSHFAASLGLEPGRREGAKGPPHEIAPPPTPIGEQLAVARTALRESAAFVLLLAVFFQLSHDNWWLPPRLRLEVPRFLQPIIVYPRLLQGWSMFSPDAPRQDGTIVVDAVTRDGRHIDIFTGKAPDFDAPLHGPWFQSQLFCDYFLKMSFDNNRGYREELKHYIMNWQRLENRPENDRVLSFDMYWVSNDAPLPGQTVPTNIHKKLLLSSK